MSQSEDITRQTARFTEAVRSLTPVRAKLLQFKDGIVELRQKGASSRLIRELLATIEVAVAVGAIGNFVREVIEQRAASRPNRRWHAVRPLSEPPTSSSLQTPSRPQFHGRTTDTDGDIGSVTLIATIHTRSRSSH